MNIFGTDGIRTKVGTYPLCTNNLINLAKAIGNWILKKNKNPKIVIAHDTRLSHSLIKSYLKAGLLEYPVQIFDAQILPSPAIYNLVHKENLFDLGLMITASHNEFQDNGIKIIDKGNDKLLKTDEELISQIFNANSFEEINYDHLGTEVMWQEGYEIYLSNIKKFFIPNFLNSKKIILDCSNGATYKTAPDIFKHFGADLITIGIEPNGKNINENYNQRLKLVQQLVIEKNAHIGFIFDGDGDRIIAVNNKGDIKDGDDILAILMNHPKYISDSVVSTIVSNYGFEIFLKNKNKKLIRVPVGDKHVAQSLKKENLLLGAEPSGHVILRDYLNSSDGVFAALRVLETLILTNNWQMQTFTKFPQYTINVPTKSKKDLLKEPFADIISSYSKKIDGRLIVRYSGTEPLLRIVVESQSLDISKEMAIKVSEELKYAFNQ